VTGKYELIADALANATTYTDNPANPTLTYAYRVTAWNAAGDSLSNVVLVDVATDRFVRRVYQDLVNHAPDPTALASWITAIQGGAPRIGVPNAVTSGTEYRTSVITGFYVKYLRRQPDAGGLASWLNGINSGVTIEQAEASFLASAEYYAKAGATNSLWVTRLYQDVLRRIPAPSEVQFWASRVDAGWSRSLVAKQFVLSPEHLRTVIRADYLQLLRRPVNATELSARVTAMQGGLRHEAVIGAIIATNEYFALP